MTTIISALPYTITQQGSYLLDRFAGYQSTDGITINADDVVLDLGGNAIVRYGDNANQNNGIYVPPNRTNINIKNGHVRGFMYGLLSYARSMTVQDMVFEDCTFRGMKIETGVGFPVPKFDFRRCSIRNVGGCTVYNPAYAFGIEVYGTGTIMDCSVSDLFVTHATAEAVGISVTDDGNVFVQDCRIFNPTCLVHSFGIWVGGSSLALLERNTVSRFQKVMGVTGLVTGLYRNNTSSECPDGYVVPAGLLDRGGNV